MTIRGKQLVTLLLFIILPTCIWAQSKRQQNNDKELLAKAIDYYQGSKYHEALLFFEQLNSRYVLNPRFKAYMAVCYYHENDLRRPPKHSTHFYTRSPFSLLVSKLCIILSMQKVIFRNKTTSRRSPTSNKACPYPTTKKKVTSIIE